MEFTNAAYCDLIKKICDSGYSICDYHDYKESINPCILRHDVDFDLKKAIRVAELEKEMGVKSTYFVLVNTNFYNIVAAESRRDMARILSLGHEIGLHFDEMQYEINGDKDGLICKIQEETEILSTILGTTVTTVSMHRPSKGLLDANVRIPGMVNSYDYVFFKEFKYFSDSRMHWREDVIGGIDREINSSLHILTHPFWYDEKVEDMKLKLQKFICNAQIERYNYLENNFKELDKVISKNEITERDREK